MISAFGVEHIEVGKAFGVFYKTRNERARESFQQHARGAYTQEAERVRANTPAPAGAPAASRFGRARSAARTGYRDTRSAAARGLPHPDVAVDPGSDSSMARAHRSLANYHAPATRTQRLGQARRGFAAELRAPKQALSGAPAVIIHTLGKNAFGVEHIELAKRRPPKRTVPARLRRGGEHALVGAAAVGGAVDIAQNHKDKDTP